MSKTRFLLLLVLLVITLPEVSADEDCGLDNLAVCIPQKMVEFVVSIFNAPADFLFDLSVYYLTLYLLMFSLKYSWHTQNFFYLYPNCKF